MTGQVEPVLRSPGGYISPAEMVDMLREDEKISAGLIKHLTTERDELLVENFNLKHKIGTKVRYWTGARTGTGKESVTRSQASLLSGHTPVVWLEGVAGCIALTHVEVIQ